MTNEQIAIRQHLSKDRPGSSACGCMGPQRGEPLCPCAMSWVEVVDGKWYRILEHRSTDGVTHTAEYLGNVGDDFSPDSCPSNQSQCKNAKIVRTRAYWTDYECHKCGAKFSTSRKK